MSTTQARPLNIGFDKAWGSLVSQRGKAFGIMIIGALLAFEVFNYSTTEFALRDVLGELKFVGIGWATILSIAFCGIDFAGIARLFTPEQGADEPAEVWYLFGAWLLAAAMNAALTWWGVSVAIVNHTSQGSAVVRSETIQTVVPIFVAVMVWVIRVLIIGTFSLAGERMFSQTEQRTTRQNYVSQPQASSARNDYRRPTVNTTPQPINRGGLVPASSLKPPQNKPALHGSPANTSTYRRPEQTYARPEPYNTRPEPASTRAEPTYHNVVSSHNAEVPVDELG